MPDRVSGGHVCLQAGSPGSLEDTVDGRILRVFGLQDKYVLWKKTKRIREEGPCCRAQDCHLHEEREDEEEEGHFWSDGRKEEEGWFTKFIKVCVHS